MLLLQHNRTAVKDAINEKLEAIERDHDVRILYACESGSRAWGFASPDSDYDVRFIYAHKTARYLSIDDRRDVIELPGNNILDVNGWELRKALRLFRKSNPPLLEWLQSPIIYRQNEMFVSEMNALIPAYFSPRVSMYHYIGLVKAVNQTEFSAETVRLKKYFYALRSILAARWTTDPGTVPPMEWSMLKTLLPSELEKPIENLYATKITSDESFRIGRNDVINAYISECMQYCKQWVPPPPVIRVDDDSLDLLFRKYIAD